MVMIGILERRKVPNTYIHPDVVVEVLTHAVTVHSSSRPSSEASIDGYNSPILTLIIRLILALAPSARGGLLSEKSCSRVPYSDQPQ
jgi:hypothetical protein